MIAIRRYAAGCLAATLFALTLNQAWAEDAVAEKQPPTKVEIAEGDLVLTAPGEWEQVTPRNRIIELEFAVKPTQESGEAARMTVMASGGSIKQNINRWIGQFRNLQAPEEGEIGQVEELEINGMTARLVDLSGDYVDSPRGPFGPKVEKKGFRMLGGILETKGSGNYFFKLIGPEELVTSQADAFREMVKSVRRK